MSLFAIHCYSMESKSSTLFYSPGAKAMKYNLKGYTFVWKNICKIVNFHVLCEGFSHV